MNLYNIVLQHNQHNESKFLEILDKHNTVFVMDRTFPPSDEDIDYITYNGLTSEGFLAGKMRDVGLSYLETTHHIQYNDWILFFDGDRMPFFNFNDLNYTDYDCVLFPCLDDPRFTLDENITEFPTDIYDFTTLCMHTSSPFWTCGFAMKYNVICEIRHLNNANNRLFNPCFDGLKYWEDISLGDSLAHNGYKIGMAPLWACVSGSIEINETDSHNINSIKRLILRNHWMENNEPIPTELNAQALMIK